MNVSGFAARLAYSRLTKPLIWLTGNRFMQEFLDGAHHMCQHLMGIGSGASCDSSGEAVTFNVLNEVRRAPFVVFDVGAHLGEYIRLAQAHLKPDGLMIHAFEPATDCFHHLNEAFGTDPKVRINNVALGSECRVGTLYSDGPFSGLACLTKRMPTHDGRRFSRAEPVRIITLNNYCRENGIDQIDLLKIDVEGHELDVMEGGKDLFQRGKIAIITFEFGSAHIDTRVFFRDIFSFLRQHGMDVFRITRSGYLYNIHEYHERHEQFWTTNFLCIRQDISPLSRRTGRIGQVRFFL